MNKPPSIKRSPGWGPSGWLVLGLFGVLTFVSAAVAAEVNLASLLAEMTNYSAVARWPMPDYVLHQCSSYDRARVGPDQPGWFANNDFSQYIRVETHNGRTEHVLMDDAGPGAVVRFWLTTGANKKGTLRLYLDGTNEPTVIIPAFDLLSGALDVGEPLTQPHPGYSATGNGGSTLMLPIPYAKHCKITWEETGDGPRYYQINYRTYAPGTTVQTFSPEALAAARPLVETVKKTLLAPQKAAAGELKSINTEIPAGETAILDLPPGPAALQWLELRVDGEFGDVARRLRSLIVQMEFDGEPTVWCPAGDFFGSGVGCNPLQSWYRTVRADGSMVCRWVMPYEKSARIQLTNLGGQPVTVSLRADTAPWAWDDRCLHFHAAWHYEANLTTPPPRDWEGIRLSGRGLYVGDTLSLFNPVATWYGEGDEKIWRDGEAFPSFIGTGMEDYYDFSFAPRGLMQTPFANQVRVGEPMTQGHNVLTRTRNLDGIPFSRSLQFDFELMSWQPTTLIYAMTTYWYAFPGGSANAQPQPDAATLPIPAVPKTAAAR